MSEAKGKTFPNATQSFLLVISIYQKAIMNISPNALPDGKSEFKGNQDDNNPFEKV